MTRLLLALAGLFAFSVACGDAQELPPSEDQAAAQLGDALRSEHDPDALGYPELSREFETVDAVGNRYLVVVRYDALTPTDIGAMDDHVTVINALNAEQYFFDEKAYNAYRADPRWIPHEQVQRPLGAHHISAYPLSGAPEPLGVRVQVARGQGSIAAPQGGGEDVIRAQTWHTDICAAGDEFGCPAANSITWYTESYWASGSAHSGDLRCRRVVSGGCVGATTAAVNSTSYSVGVGEDEVLDSIGCVHWGSTKTIHFDADSGSGCIDSDVTYQIWY